MIKQVVDDHSIDPTCVFITGMSSGGAMATVMLATYPGVFAGGAIIAGLPYRSADGREVIEKYIIGEWPTARQSWLE
jgi:poly(3-hydroxybutyrate) depolymerase